MSDERRFNLRKEERGEEVGRDRGRTGSKDILCTRFQEILHNWK